MEMEMASVIGITVVAVVVAVLFRQYRPEYGVLISLITGILLLGLVVKGLTPAIEQISNLAEKVGMYGDYTDVLVKSLGICFLTQIACDTCKDAGESAIASKVELAGKAAVVILTLPLFQKLLSIALDLISA